MSLSPSRHGSLPGSVAKSRGRVKFFTPAGEGDDPKAGGGKANRLSRRNSLTLKQQHQQSSSSTLAIVQQHQQHQQQQYGNNNMNNNNMDADDDEFIPDIDYNDVLPLSLQYREEMQILLDEQEAYEMMKKQESLKTSVLASEGVASAVIIASPDHQGMFGGGPSDADGDNALKNKKQKEDEEPEREKEDAKLQQEQGQENILNQLGGSTSLATSLTLNNTSSFVTVEDKHRMQRKEQNEVRNILYSQFMDVHSFGYALPKSLEKELQDYESHPSQKSKLARRPVEFECTADITDEYHGEDMEDNVRDMVLQEKLQAQEMSYQAAVSSTKAARWDLDRIFFLAMEDSSDDSEGATEDIESEWREETSQIYQTCRRVESSVHQMRYFYPSNDPEEDDDNNNSNQQKKREEMKMEQEKAATEFVEMIRSLHGYKCAPLFSAYSTELRSEQAMTNVNGMKKRNEDGNEDESDDDGMMNDDEDDDDGVQEAGNSNNKDEDNPYLLKSASPEERRRTARNRRRRVTERRVSQLNTNQVSFSLTPNGKRVKNKALESVQAHHITPSERAMIWDTLRKVYQFAEPVHTKRWLSATSRLYEEPSFVDYQSVSTVSHIFFAAVRHLKEALQPRLHEKLKRWANRCLYLIQRRSLTLNEFGVTQPTYKAVNVSCAGRSRDTPMETRRLPNILTLISDIHDHKIKQEKREKQMQEKDAEVARLKEEFIAKYIAAASFSSNRMQQIRNQQPERKQQMLHEAEEAWELNEKPLVEEELMMTKYDEGLFGDGASDDSYDDEEDEDDDQWGGAEVNKDALEKLNRQNTNGNTNNNSGNNSGRNNNNNNNYTSSNNNISGAATATGRRSPLSGYHEDTQSEFSRSIFGESESNFAGSYVRSRRDSSRTNTTVFDRKSSFATSSPNRHHQSQQLQHRDSNVFAQGDRLYFDFNERQRIQQEKEAKQKQMDPRRKKKETRARRRAQMFAELKRTAMEERAQQELKEELMNFRETMMSS